MPVYHLIEYSDKIFRNISSFMVIPALNDSNKNIANFGEDNATTNSFKIKEKITGQIRNNGRKDVEIMVPLKYLSNFVELMRCL